MYLMEFNSSDVKDFFDEAVILHTLKSPRIVECYGICVMPPAITMVLEFWKYGSLFDFLHKNSADKHGESSALMSYIKNLGNMSFAAQNRSTIRQSSINSSTSTGIIPDFSKCCRNSLPYLQRNGNMRYFFYSASIRGDLDLVLLLLNRGADPNVKNNSGRSPRQVLLHSRKNYNHSIHSSHKTIQDILERWGVLMTIKLLRKLRVFHWLDLSMRDLYEYIGQEARPF
jgi:hypothetical protein